MNNYPIINTYNTIKPNEVDFILYFDEDNQLILEVHPDIDENHPASQYVDYDNIRTYHDFVYNTINQFNPEDDMENVFSLHTKTSPQDVYQHLITSGWKPAPYWLTSHLDTSSITYIGDFE